MKIALQNSSKCQDHNRLRKKKKVRNYPRLEETKQIWQLNAVWDPAVDLGPGKDILGTAGKNVNKIYRWVMSIVFTIFINFLVLMVLLWLPGDEEEEHAGIICTIFVTFHKSEIITKWKLRNKKCIKKIEY